MIPIGRRGNSRKQQKRRDNPVVPFRPSIFYLSPSILFLFLSLSYSATRSHSSSWISLFPSYFSPLSPSLPPSLPYPFPFFSHPPFVSLSLFSLPSYPFPFLPIKSPTLRSFLLLLLCICIIKYSCISMRRNTFRFIR